MGGIGDGGCVDVRHIPHVQGILVVILGRVFAFMMVFSQLASLYLGRISPVAGKQLRMCALVFGILALLAFIAVFVAFQFLVE